MKPLTGRTALVTGAGNGIGRAMIVHLHRAGARVILSGRDRNKLESCVEELGLASAEHRLASVDVSDPDSVAGLKEQLADEDVSVLVNNAGVPGPVAELVDISPNEWDDVFATNVRGVYLMCRAFLPSMMAAGMGDVVNVASVSGKRPLIRRTPYCASKMAVIGLSTTLAFEAGPSGVRVNTLSPGPVNGPRMARNFTLEADRNGGSYADAEAAFVSRSALGRMVEEDEVGAALVALLAMPGLTGADIDLSAGMVAR